MHFELPGLAMNSHLGSVGSSVAAAGSACAANAASASPTSAPSTQPRSVLIAFPSLRLAPGRAPDQEVRGPLCVAANRSTFLGLRNSAAPPPSWGLYVTPNNVQFME